MEEIRRLDWVHGFDFFWWAGFGFGVDVGLFVSLLHSFILSFFLCLIVGISGMQILVDKKQGENSF